MLLRAQIMKLRKFRFILYGILLLALVGAVVFGILRMRENKKGFYATQAIIENLSIYKSEIESWGYQVSIFDPLHTTEEDPHSVLSYYGLLDPVLILTDSQGGMWFFYNGFDQFYQSTTTLSEMTLSLIKEKKTLLKTVELWLQKANRNRPAVQINSSKQNSRAYYDIEVSIDIQGASPDTGEHLLTWEGGLNYVWYCSNNFEEYRWFGVIDPQHHGMEANRVIKKEFSAQTLLGFYQQGLQLQERLINLYNTNKTSPSQKT